MTIEEQLAELGAVAIASAETQEQAQALLDMMTFDARRIAAQRPDFNLTRWAEALAGAVNDYLEIRAIGAAILAGEGAS